MNYLLDTHIVVWWLMDSRKIAPKVREIIADKTNKILLVASHCGKWQLNKV